MWTTGLSATDVLVAKDLTHVGLRVRFNEDIDSDANAGGEGGLGQGEGGGDAIGVSIGIFTNKVQLLNIINKT